MPPSLGSESSQYNGNIYEESFAEILDPTLHDHLISEAASISRDDKLLSFRLPNYNFTLLDYSLRRTSLSLQAQLHGMFFMAQPSNDTVIEPPTDAELTCYRRNLFQVTGSITLPRTMRYVMTDQGDRIPIVGQELSISATESVEGHPVKLISVPWKTPASNANATPDDKAEKEPTSIQLDTMANQDMDADYATFPIAWKRLQFRIATANNGRRKELQQHFVVRLKVLATLSSGARVSICEAASGAIIVRGRSPRNFQQRKDMPVGRDTGGSRKTNSHSLKRNTSTESQHAVKTDKHSPIDGTSTFNIKIESAPLPDHGSATASNGPKAVHRSSYSTSAVPSDQLSSPGLPQSPTKSTRITRSTNSSSVVEQGHTPSHKAKLSRTISSTSSEATSSAFKRHSTSQSGNTYSLSSDHSLQRGVSSLDPSDLLYEYFPLGVDDWQPPVDAVYRPHVVHHIASGPVHPAGGAMMGGGRNRRYFSEDFG